MKRKDFLKSCTGMCSCAAFGLLAPADAKAQSAAPENPEAAALGRKLDAAQARFAALVGILNRELDPPTRTRVLRGLGSACADRYKDMFDKYKNDLRGFLDYARTEWVEEASFEEGTGTIQVVDRSPKCVCPLVKQGETPGEFCECTLGWQKAAYSTILGKPVEVELVDSVLRGGRRCSFRIRIA
jgi:predicted hydrocarbon binding protein